jgi:hypothetical protein
VRADGNSRSKRRDAPLKEGRLSWAFPLRLKASARYSQCGRPPKLDEECQCQVVLPRRQLFDDSEIMDFLFSYVGRFDMYVEDDYAAFVRYCFEDPMDAAVFRSRFEPKVIQAGRVCRDLGARYFMRLRA